MTTSFTKFGLAAIFSLTAGLAQTAIAQEAAPMTAALNDAKGASVGTVTLTPAAAGGVLLKMDLSGLPQGTLAVHLHETGTCTAPDFKSAGGHIAGAHEHGVLNPKGAHAGDLPNLEVGPEGTVKAEVFAPAITAAQLNDADGAAIVIHAGPDDYQSQPAGNSGDRIACGVLKAS